MLEQYEWLPLAYLFLVFFGFVTMMGQTLVVYRWRKRSIASQMFFWLISAMTLWIFANLGQLFSTHEDIINLLKFIKYIGVAFVPVFVFLFSLAFARREHWLKPTLIIPVVIIPILTQVIHLFRPDLFLYNATYQTLFDFTFHVSDQRGVWFEVHTFYSYILILVTIANFGYDAVTEKFPFNRQAGVMILGIVVPFVINIYDVFFPSLLPPWDWTVVTFSITVTFWTYALYQYRLLDLMPVARSAIIENMQDAVIVLDRDKRIVDINPYGADLIGKPSQELLGNSLLSYMENAPQLVAEYTDATDIQTEITLNTQIYDMRIATVPNGRYILLRNITARKQAESEREQLIEELNAYAHTVAHDLKNPISTLIGNADFLQELHEDGEFDGPDVVNSLSAVVNLSYKMTAIIDELLLLASVRDQKKVAFAPLNMRGIVGQALERLTIQLGDAEIAWEWEETETAVGYSAWVEEIWMNYLSNALKYGGSPPSICIGSRTEGQINRYWVQDNGEGVPVEKQKTLFVKFNRLEHHLRAEGHGLGLSIVERIVTRLGGNVGLTSELGKGSCFYFTLPVQTEPIPAKTAAIFDDTDAN